MEDPTEQEHLAQLASQLFELYLLERSRNAELTTAIRRHLAADHNDGSADDLRDDLRDALKGTADA
jgi:hypothetical protein